jgi:hypothetical protein
LSQRAQISLLSQSTSQRIGRRISAASKRAPLLPRLHHRLPIKFELATWQHALHHHAVSRRRCDLLPGGEEVIHAIVNRHPSRAASDANAARLFGAQRQSLRGGQYESACASM